MPTRSINERLQRLARELGLAHSEVFFTVGPTVGPFLYVLLRVGADSHMASCQDSTQVDKWFPILLAEAEAAVGIYEPAQEPVEMFESINAMLRAVSVFGGRA